MADGESTIYEIHFDTGKLEEGLDDLAGGIDTVKTAVGKLEQSISKAFSSGMRLLQGIDAGVANNGKQIANAAKTLGSDISKGLGEIAGQLCAIQDAMKDAISQMGKMNPADGVGAVSDSMDVVKSVFGQDAIEKTIGALIRSTAEWLAHTAAVVGDTVATWAHVAATTAWQAICTAATAVTTAFGMAMNFLASPIGIAIAAITALIAIIVLLIMNWDTVSQTVQNVCTVIQQKLEQFDGFLQNIFAKDFTEQFGAFGHVINAFVANIENVWNAIRSVFSGIVTFISGVFSGDWSKAWDGIKEVFSGVWQGLMASVKGPINGIIGYINALVSGLVAGVNLIIKALNGLSFNIPDWVPELGGQTFGFSLSPLTAPRIPLLAQGAVLPANKPFLAVVGDQRHGTNIEAPLTTIQEAVAMVMNDQVAAMMAGFEATVEEVRLLRQMVSGIEIGDNTIGQAARRYERKMAVVTGGRY